jgi:hypothetical protein
MVFTPDILNSYKMKLRDIAILWSPEGLTIDRYEAEATNYYFSSKIIHAKNIQSNLFLYSSVVDIVTDP